MIERMEMQTKDLSQEKIRMLGELFPDCITESKEGDKVVLSVDFDALRQDLSNHVVEGPKERYQFTWPDKNKARVLANTPTTMTLRPCRKESVDFDTTKNLYIKGDNLEVLKILRETYLGKVKMIYIDPPYNTGNDFVYNDDFSINNADYLRKSGDISESGNRLVLNTSTNGRFHTDWLNMMYPRLLLAKDLLTDDGAIFVSIGDDEEANLIKICDEIFGEHNFVANICHKSRASISNDRIISENHNHLLFYSKNIQTMFNNHKIIGEDPILDGFNNKDERGEYKLTPVDGPGGAKKGNPFYEFMGISGYWRYSKETMQKMYDEGLIVKTKNNLQRKYYKEDALKSRRTVSTWWDDDFLTSSATSSLIKLMGGKYFDNPKNVNLITRCLKLITKYDKNAIIMDFFSGSATTADAVLQFNSTDNGNRRYILIQLPENTPENSEARKAGYKDICEIGINRIICSGREIERKLQSSSLDLGFRVFKLDSSNTANLFDIPDNYTKKDIDRFTNMLKHDRSSEDLLIQVMLELGIELSAKIEEEIKDDIKAWVVDEGYLLAFTSDKCSEDVVTYFARNLKPVFAVFRNDIGMSDEMLSNIEQIFKIYSPGTIVRLI